MPLSAAEIGWLATAVKLERGECLGKGRALDAFLRNHPEADVREARAACLAMARCPWPSVTGNPPVKKERPFWDARWWERYAD